MKHKLSPLKNNIFFKIFLEKFSVFKIKICIFFHGGKKMIYQSHQLEESPRAKTFRTLLSNL